MMTAYVIVILTLAIACTVGYTGYLAFGSGCKSVIIYNLPAHDTSSIITKIFYLITICGSFVLVIQPIFHVIETSNFYDGRCSDLPKDESEETPAEPRDDLAPGEEQPQDEESWSCLRWTKFLVVRTSIVLILLLISTIIPNISILITFAGAVLGTIINVVLPVLFYNRAYNSKTKNLKLIKANIEERRKRIAEGADPETIDLKDPRRTIKIISWFVFVLGIFIGIYGFVYVIMEFANQKPDE